MHFGNRSQWRSDHERRLIFCCLDFESLYSSGSSLFSFVHPQQHLGGGFAIGRSCCDHLITRVVGLIENTSHSGRYNLMCTLAMHIIACYPMLLQLDSRDINGFDGPTSVCHVQTGAWVY